MDIAFIGLGKMGGNMVRRLLRGGHRVVVYARNPSAVDEFRGEGAVGASTIEELVKLLPTPRVVWLMVPAGAAVDENIAHVQSLLQRGDVIVDGGNSRFSDTVSRGKKLALSGIHYVDAGTSGGIWGLQEGYCLMVGGEKEAVKVLEPGLKTLAPEGGYLHVGPSGAGHYVKMVHNGIEYGMMQAYAEGFEILESCEYPLDLHAITCLWNKGSVVRSWLLELSENIFEENPKLEGLKGFVQDSGEGRWTVEESIRLSVPAPVITSSLQVRFASRKEDAYANRYLSALRNQFGGHAVKKA